MFTSSGGLVTTIADGHGPIGFIGSYTINSAGVVAFTAVLDDGTRGIFFGSGGPITTIAQTDGPFDQFDYGAAINDAGAVIFQARLDAGGQGLFVNSGGSMSTIADTSGPFTSLGDFSINNAGSVAFVGTSGFPNHGIFTGDDPAADKVIHTGDSLFGSIVDSLGFYRGLNDMGDIAFSYTLKNGVTGIAVARVIPEPAALKLLLIASIGLIVPRR
jgi:hypothetical protein